MKEKHPRRKSQQCKGPEAGVQGHVLRKQASEPGQREQGEGRRRRRGTIQHCRPSGGLVSASEDHCVNGGCGAEEGHEMTSRLAPCSLAACGERTEGGGRAGRWTGRLDH